MIKTEAVVSFITESRNRILLQYSIVPNPDKMWEGTIGWPEYQETGILRAVWEAGYHKW